MNESEALREIRRVAGTGLIVLTRHARIRMDQRGVLPEDIRPALRDATRAQMSGVDHASDWTVTGRDRAGDELTLGVVLSGGIIIITVY